MEKPKICFSEFLIRVGSSPVWTLTNVGINFYSKGGNIIDLTVCFNDEVSCN